MCEKHVFLSVRADFGTEQEKPEPCVGFNTTKGKPVFFFVSDPIIVGLLLVRKAMKLKTMGKSAIRERVRRKWDMEKSPTVGLLLLIDQSRVGHLFTLHAAYTTAATVHRCRQGSRGRTKLKTSSHHHLWIGAHDFEDAAGEGDRRHGRQNEKQVGREGDRVCLLYTSPSPRD